MIPLAMPQKAAKEDKTLATLCKKKAWAPYGALWLAAYESYRAAKGDPWKLTPAVFSGDPTEAVFISELQRGFYKSRASGGPIARIRRTPSLLCCPMCGSGHPGTLDHYLPREAFPEFSILPTNLVPACSHCNSGVKGGRYRGAATPERFIHPYYDVIANGEIWFVEVQPPFAAARFHPRVATTVAAGERQMVDFHLRHILGNVFQDYVATQWAQLPLLLRGRFTPHDQINEAKVLEELTKNLRDTRVTNGHNSWRSALLRGVIENAAAITFLVGRTTQVVPVPT